MSFTHLHTHTEYSLLDGSNKISKYVAKVKELGMTSAAMTDHGVMYGAIEFYKCAKENGINPIIGCEVYVAPGSRFDKSTTDEGRYHHLVLLAENNKGYENLVKIVSKGFTEGFYYKPRVDKELLKEYHEGIIALSACLAGEISYRITRGEIDKAKEVIQEHIDIFGKNNFFLEIQDHGIPEERMVITELLTLSKEFDIPLVATNDIHYTNAEDAESHDVLLCIQTGKLVSDEKRMRYEGGQYYVKSEAEMLDLFNYAKEAVYNTQTIADRCHVEIEFGNYKIPKFMVPEGYQDAEEYLIHLCEEGFTQKYPEEDKSNSILYKDMQYELSIIKKMGFIEYILIVWDYINWSKTHDCWVGPGRGSAAGSKVCYCIGITNIDPVKYNLLFERFLNPDRVSMPDIDVDFEYAERQRVIDEYIIPHYKNVTQIITFQTMAARAVIKAVGKVMEFPYSETDRLSKMIPDELHITINKAMEMNPELKDIYEKNTEIKNLLDTAMKLEGLPKSTSTHAAGVIIYPGEASDYLPLGRSAEGVFTCQYNMTQIEELGLLKMDFLGLKTLTVIKDAIKNVKKEHGIDIDIDLIDLNDKNVLKFIGTGDTDGIFQLESPGMQGFMKQLKPQDFEDIIAGISLYRPGPMDFIPDYIKGKSDQSAISYVCPELESILSATYGCIVYQEQVMQIVQKLAGYTMAQADNIRRAMSKKKQAVIDKEREFFINGNQETGIVGCIANGISAEAANKIYNSMVNFAKYAFNKSHAAAYAVISMQTAWLKYYYPVEYMAALMSSVIDAPPKLVGYIQACKDLKIEILPPDVNKSEAIFVAEEGKIRFALTAIKSVGPSVIKDLVEERTQHGNYESFYDLIKRCNRIGIGKKCIECFIKAGALSTLHGNRHQFLSIYESAMGNIERENKKTMEGQLSLFDMCQDEDYRKELHLPDVEEYSKEEILNYEKEVTGIYISGHPLDEYAHLIKRNSNSNASEFKADNETGMTNVQNEQKVKVCGLIKNISVKYTKTQKQMAFIEIEDLCGTIEVIVFPKTYENCKKILYVDNKVIAQGKVSTEEEKDAKILADRIDGFEVAPRKVWVNIKENTYPTVQEQFFSFCKKNSGINMVCVYCKDTKKYHPSPGSIIISEETIKTLEKMFGKENVAIT